MIRRKLSREHLSAISAISAVSMTGELYQFIAENIGANFSPWAVLGRPVPEIPEARATPNLVGNIVPLSQRKKGIGSTYQDPGLSALKS